MRLLWGLRLGLPAVLAVLGVIAVVQSLDFPPLARYFPLVVATALTLLCLAVLGVAIVQLVRSPVEGLKTGGSNDTAGLLVEGWQQGPEEFSWVVRRMLVSVAVLGGAIVTYAIVGAVLGSGLFIAFCQWRLVRARWWAVALAGAATSLAVWFISYQFHLIQPTGLLDLRFGLR